MVPAHLRPTGMTRAAVLLLFTLSFLSTLSQAAVPGTISIVNPASYVGGITPGSIATIFGSNLTRNVVGVYAATTDPLPFELQGITVLVNGIQAPIQAVARLNTGSQDQINFQTPYEAASGATALVQVFSYGSLVGLVQADVLLENPGVFTIDGTNGLFVRNSDNSLISRSSPARAGEPFYFYATGLGPVVGGPGLGAGASGISYAQGSVQVQIAGRLVPVLFAGLAPHMPGIFQVNVQLPADFPSGNWYAILFVNGRPSQIVKIPIR